MNDVLLRAATAYNASPGADGRIVVRDNGRHQLQYFGGGGQPLTAAEVLLFGRRMGFRPTIEERLNALLADPLELGRIAHAYRVPSLFLRLVHRFATSDFTSLTPDQADELKVTCRIDLRETDPE